MPIRTKDVTDKLRNAAVSTATQSFGTVKKTLTGIGGILSQSVERVSAPIPKFFSSPGAKPGIEDFLEQEEAHGPVSVIITCIDYGPTHLSRTKVDDIDSFLKEPRKENTKVRWLNIDGLSAAVVHKLQEHFGFHLLAAEDVLNVYQRPKCEDYDSHLFLVTRQMTLLENKLINEQISMFLFGDTLITFQEMPGDVFDPVRERLNRESSRFRQAGTDYLLYTLLDSLVDHLFPLCERYGNAMEDLEESITRNPQPVAQQALFAMKRDLSSLKRQLWPTREMLLTLERQDCDLVTDATKTFLRDVYDHCIQALEVIESYRETASGLNDLYHTSVANKMNEVMKVLTIMASFFIPITFVAGVYGMNFEHIPELGFEYSYYIFWGVCFSITIGLFVFFKRKGWIGG